MRKELLTILVISLILTAFLTTQVAKSSTTKEIEDPLFLTIKTNAQKYLLRQKIVVEGNLTQDGTPPTDAVIALQIDNSLGTAIAYKTVTIGNPEKMWMDQRWPINITSIRLTDLDGKPINTAKTNNQIRVHVTVYNPQPTQRQAYITVTVYDANMVPLKASGSQGTIGPQQSTTLTVYVYIPNWACSGKSLITANVYSKPPKEGGTPLAPEKSIYYSVSRVQQGLFQYPELPPPQQQVSPGWFRAEVTLSPEPRAGQYVIHSVAQTSLTSIRQTQTTFTVENSQGYPPTASFVYWPTTPYENQTVQFDASSSTPEGFNDTITSYKWNFGDGTPPVTKTDPYITHTYLNAGTYIITLNVTDSEGLWSTTQKPIYVRPEFGPTANFTWTPPIGVVNTTVTFNASDTQLGWSKKLASFAPIKQYTWNFGDGTGNVTVTTPIITHTFTQLGNYSVTLTVVDVADRSNSVTKIIQILNVTEHPWDINGDRIVDARDLWLAAKAYGSRPGSPNWDPRCDIDRNGIVDGRDLWLIAKHYGERY